jgi:hypothetical protein
VPKVCSRNIRYGQECNLLLLYRSQLLKCCFRFGKGRVGDDAGLTGTANVPPLADNTLASEQVGLDVQMIEAKHVQRKIDEVKGNVMHGLFPR